MAYFIFQRIEDELRGLAGRVGLQRFQTNDPTQQDKSHRSGHASFPYFDLIEVAVWPIAVLEVSADPVLPG